MQRGAKTDGVRGRLDQHIGRRLELLEVLLHLAAQQTLTLACPDLVLDLGEGHDPGLLMIDHHQNVQTAPTCDRLADISGL